MPEKKSDSEIDKRHKEVYRRIARVYEKLKEGPASVEELADKLKNDSAFVKIRSVDGRIREVYSSLNILKRIGVVEKGKDGKYRVKRKIILKDDALLNALLQHSKNLLSDFLAILGERSYFKLPDPSEIFSNEKYKYLLEHLKTEYQGIYSNMEEMIRIEEEIQDYQKELCERIRGYLLEYNIPIEVEKEVMSGGVYSAISSMFGGSEGIVDDRIRDVVKL
jgi:DNA-binding transcriptional ArsR family regulator